MKTIDEYLISLGIEPTGRSEKKMVQLALDVKNMNTAQMGRMCDTWMAFEKLDGVYSFVTCIAREDGTYDVNHWGRTGKRLSGTELLDFALGQALEDAGMTFSVVLISEVCSDGHLAKLSGYLNPNRKDTRSPPPGLRDAFHDQLSLAEFIEGVAPRQAELRHCALTHLLKEIGYSDKLVDYTSADMETLEYLADTVWAVGGEGVIGRDPDAFWEAGKRDERQIKMKEQADFDCEVVGICSGKDGSKYELCTGKLLVAFRAFGRSDGDVILLPVGSGLTDEQREEFYAAPDRVLGRIIKVKAKSFTEFGNLREPVIVEFRDDLAEPQFHVTKGEWQSYTKGKANWSHYEIS